MISFFTHLEGHKHHFSLVDSAEHGRIRKMKLDNIQYV
jgi:hypothetical protein